MTKNAIQTPFMVSIVFRGNGLKPGKHNRKKQRCQDLDWKFYDRAQYFAHTLSKDMIDHRSYTHKLSSCVYNCARYRELL